MEDKSKRLEVILIEAYEAAETIVDGGGPEIPAGIPCIEECIQLAKLKHAFRGVAVTLLGYKLADNDQDIRAHKDEYENGFSARSFDTKVTVPFLIDRSLPRSVKTHWLTQTLSFAGPLTEDQQLKTVPKAAGPLLTTVVNAAQKATPDELQIMLAVMMAEMIRVRNRDIVVLTRPKSLAIERVQELLNKHFQHPYKNNAPRLPQLAIYAIYESLIKHIHRYDHQQLAPLERLKSADRKSGAVGDIVVIDQSDQPAEAVEIKFGQPITYIHVAEAIEKIRAATVLRYYLLSD